MQDGRSTQFTDGGEQFDQFVFMVRALENRVWRDPHVATPEVVQHVSVICEQAHMIKDDHPDLEAVCESLQSIQHLRAPELGDRLHEIAAKVNDAYEHSGR